MRRDYLIAILVGFSAFPLGAALMVAPYYLHLTGYLVPLTFWGGLVLAAALIAIAILIASRGERSAHNSTFSPQSHRPRNVLLLDAIWRVHLGKWGDRIDYGNDMDARMSFEKTTGKVRQLARDGKLPVWGIKQRGNTFDPIPLGFWSTHYIEAGYVTNPLVKDT
jgi:hypothetical protein